MTDVIIEMKTAIMLDRDDCDELRDFDFTSSSSTTLQKTAFREFLDTTITESVSFGQDGEDANFEDYQFSPRDYLTCGGPFGALTDAAVAWTDDIAEEDDPIDAMNCLRADLEDYLSHLNKVLSLFNRYRYRDVVPSKAA